MDIARNRSMPAMPAFNRRAAPALGPPVLSSVIPNPCLRSAGSPVPGGFRAKVPRPDHRWATGRASLVTSPPAQVQLTEELKASAHDGYIPVEFKLHCATAFGEMVKVVGSRPELGCWALDRAVPMTWTKGDIWTTTIKLQPRQSYEFKCVVYNAKGNHQQWEKGPNRHLDMAEAPTVLDLEWNSEAALLLNHAGMPITRAEREAWTRERSAASELIFQAFTNMVAASPAGAPWAAQIQPSPVAEANEEVPAEYDDADAEFAQVVKALEMEMEPVIV